MLATSTPFQDMDEGLDQYPAFRVNIALPGGLYNDVTITVANLQVEQSSTSDMPEGTRLLDGYPAASATFTLSGFFDGDEANSAGWLFGPYSTTSPLWRQDAFRCPVTIEQGFYPDGSSGVPEMLRRFTGYVDKYTVSVDGSVEFTCIDLRSDLRGSVVLPPVVTLPPYNAGLTSEFALDALLRSASNGAVSSWPSQRPQCVLAVGLRSSLWPEVGSIDLTYTQPIPSFATGPYGSALASANSAATELHDNAWKLAASPNGDVYLEGLFQVTVPNGAAITVGSYRGSSGAGTAIVRGVTIRVAPTSARLYIDTAAVVTVVGDFTTPHKIAAQVHYVGTLSEGDFTGTLWVDGSATTFSRHSTDSEEIGYARPASTMQVASASGTGVAGFQVTTEGAPAVQSFTPRAVFDPSLNPLQVMPATDGDPWDVIQQIAQAELGYAGFDEAGVFRFRNRDTLRGGTSVRTVTSRNAIKTLGFDQSAASVINRAQIGYTNWTFASAASAVYSLDAAKRIPARQSTVIIANLDTYAARIDTSVAKLPNSSTNITDSWYRASTTAAGATEHPGLSFTVTQTAANAITITVINSTSQDAWLVSPSNYTDMPVGTPLLRIGGFAVTPNTELSADWQFPPVGDGGAAGTRFKEVLYTQTGNPWVQDDDTALDLAKAIVDGSSQPIPNLTGIEIVPDPRLQLGDRIRLIDYDTGTGLDEYAQIFNINTSLDGDSSSMTIDARTIARPGGWILGVSGRSELGTTTWI